MCGHCLQVCGGYALSLFRYDELERLVCGLPHLDFEALKAAARYEAGYHAAHPTIEARSLLNMSPMWTSQVKGRSECLPAALP